MVYFSFLLCQYLPSWNRFSLQNITYIITLSIIVLPFICYLTEKWPFFRFSCECPDGKFGVTCDEESSACTTGRHNCAEGSECTVMKDGSYECLCPLGTYFLMKLSCKIFTYTLFMLQSCKNIIFIFAISYMSWIDYICLIRYCFKNNT